MGTNQELISKVSASQKRNNLPEFRTGDTIKVHVKIKEGEKERIQMFEGFVLKRSGTNSNDATFTVRKQSFGVGVEKTFFVNSPIVAAIEVIKPGSVRQSKIFYMRNRKGKSARIKPREIKK
ncbi:MAG: 50S ribosomal protein L19 [Candidatus Tyloplasma litorale]|nr:MAG: 50S ribosomal protein L19 [Mycoplasmatales bacterium]